MKTAIFDLETTTLHANTGILLCAVIRHYDSEDAPIIIRADQFSTWEHNRSNPRLIVCKVLKELDKFDMFVAHNGQRFDKPMLVSWAIKYNKKPLLRFAKFIDPVLLARRHMRLARNSLHELIRFLNVPEDKTAIEFDHWLRAGLDGNRRSLDYIVHHCVQDVKALEMVYNRVKDVVKDINERGSAS